jgi:two-component system phosphate regulon sensor histidine kinase PhoR
MVENTRLRWRASALYVLGILVLSAILLLALLLAVRSAHNRGLERMLRVEAGLTAGNPDLTNSWRDNPAELAALLDRWAATTAGQLTAIDSSGVVLAHTGEDDIIGLDLGATAEVRQALTQGYGRSVRPFGPDEASTLFVALPVLSPGGDAIGVLRWSVPLSLFNGDLRRLQLQIALLALAFALLLSAAVVIERRRTAALLRRITAMLEDAAQQDFDGHILATGLGELGRLSAAGNRLVDKYRKAAKRRARERDRLHTILTQMTNGALILSDTGRVRVINPVAAAILRTTPERALRQSFVQVVWDHRVAEVWQRCVQSGAEETESVELGVDRFVRVTVTPFLGGDASGYLVILQDLTPQRRLEKIRRDFVSNVSHELRTPLASLGALVDTLRDGALEDPPAARRFLDRMDVEVDKMTQMVQELLELSRIESGQLPLRLNPIAVSQFVQPALDRLAMQAERAGISMRATYAPELPRVIADGERMQQVVINLLHNAIKFTNSGGEVEVHAEPTDVDAGSHAGSHGGTHAGSDAGSDAGSHTGSVTVSVRDSGVGIPAKDQERIFERFYKTDRARSGGGTGLGLAIAKHTVQAHGGRIWVVSQEGRGSTFAFTLPADNPFPLAELDADVDAEMDADLEAAELQDPLNDDREPTAPPPSTAA